MSWDIDRSRQRVKKHLESIGEIEIEALVREADLDALLTESRCREIFGSHLYVAVSNFPQLASETTSDTEFRRLIQMVHVYQREVSRLVETTESFDGLRVHFQGPKLHALFYRPIEDETELATRAFIMQLIIQDFVKSVFNPAFPSVGNFVVSAGADIGTAIGTRNGQRADRELLFIGSPANRAAKIIRGHGYLRLTEGMFHALPKDLQERCERVCNEGDYRIVPLKSGELGDLVREHGHTWDPKASAERVTADKEALPLRDIDYAGAIERIDFDQLSARNNKKVTAASLFADVTGFTAFVEAATDRDSQRNALRAFHAIRKEMAAVIKSDFAGVRVQFQGDRVQGLFHVPQDEHAAISVEAVECAAGLQSSMELSLREALPDLGEMHLAVGIDRGVTLASKLGTRNHRDRICLGHAVEAAAVIEDGCAAGETGVGKAVYEFLPEEMQEAFTWSEGRNCYVAGGLTMSKLGRLRRASTYAHARTVTVNSAVGGTIVDAHGGHPNGRSTPVSRSYCRE